MHFLLSTAVTDLQSFLTDVSIKEMQSNVAMAEDSYNQSIWISDEHRVEKGWCRVIKGNPSSFTENGKKKRSWGETFFCYIKKSGRDISIHNFLYANHRTHHAFSKVFVRLEYIFKQTDPVVCKKPSYKIKEKAKNLHPSNSRLINILRSYFNFLLLSPA